MEPGDDGGEQFCFANRGVGLEIFKEAAETGRLLVGEFPRVALLLVGEQQIDLLETASVAGAAGAGNGPRRGFRTPILVESRFVEVAHAAGLRHLLHHRIGNRHYRAPGHDGAEIAGTDRRFQRADQPAQFGTGAENHRIPQDDVQRNRRGAAGEAECGDRQRGVDVVDRSGGAPAPGGGQKKHHTALEGEQPLEPRTDFGERDVFIAHPERLHHRIATEIGRQRGFDAGDQHFPEDRAVGHRQCSQADTEGSLRIVKFIIAPGLPEQIELFDDLCRNRVAGGAQRGKQVVEIFFGRLFKTGYQQFFKGDRIHSILRCVSPPVPRVLPEGH